MLDLDSIEAVDGYDGEAIHAFGLDVDTGNWRWAHIPLESIYEAGRDDLVEAFGLDGGYALAA
jgi:hypothetical protein